jgi:DNA polymerase-3 subunit beta
LATILKFNVDRAAFQKALQQIDNIIPAREIRSVVSNFLLEAKDNQLTLTATDLEMSIQTHLEAKVDVPGKMTLPARKLSETVRVYQSETLPFSVDENYSATLIDSVGSSKTTITINGQSSDEYPVIPWPEDGEYTSIPAGALIVMIRKTSYAIAEEDARYMFNGLYMQSNKKSLTFVATDGRRLSKIDRKFDSNLPFDKKGIIVPGKAVRELLKILDHEAVCDISFNEAEQKLNFKLGNIRLQTRLIDANFPDYKQVIPAQVGSEVLIDRTAFETSIRKVAVMAIDASRQIQLDVSSNTIHLKAATPDLGKGDNTLACQYNGENITIAFNSIYLLDVLKVIEADEIKLGFTSASSPAIIYDSTDSDFLAVVMPMKIEQ